jgi:hypothetical protein
LGEEVTISFGTRVGYYHGGEAAQGPCAYREERKERKKKERKTQAIEKNGRGSQR